MGSKKAMVQKEFDEEHWFEVGRALRMDPVLEVVARFLRMEIGIGFCFAHVEE